MKPMETELSDRAVQLLYRRLIAHVVTADSDRVTPDGVRISKLWYMLVERNTIMLNTTTSRFIYRNLLYRQHCAICIGEPYQYVELHGFCRVVLDEQTAQADIRTLAMRYDGENGEKYYNEVCSQQKRVSLYFEIEGVREYWGIDNSALNTTESLLLTTSQLVAKYIQSVNDRKETINELLTKKTFNLKTALKKVEQEDILKTQIDALRKEVVIGLIIFYSCDNRIETELTGLGINIEELKIFYTSLTHSQLTRQFLTETIEKFLFSSPVVSFIEVFKYLLVQYPNIVQSVYFADMRKIYEKVKK